ncbi:O119 family O-antigen flippase [Escherichia coli]|nr:O119 family O-antigen flippase [Escherichia coli]
MVISNKANIASNYLSKLWGVLSIYIFIPFYISILGEENYALIAFQSVILSFVFIADGGLGAAFSRECAKEKNRDCLKALLFSVEKVMFIILLIIASIFYFCSNLIASKWLKIENIDFLSSAVISLKLMAICIIPQVMLTLYYGGIMGLEKQVLANIINICYTFCRSGLVLVPIFFYKDVVLYFGWYLIVSFLFVFIFRWCLLRQLNLVKKPAVVDNADAIDGFSILKGLLSFSFGMFCLSIVSAVNNQLDKLYVSYEFSLNDFTFYNISAILGQSAFLLVLPLAVTVLPALTKLVGGEGDAGLRDYTYERFSYIVSALSSICVFSLIYYLNDIIKIWLGDVYLNSSIEDLVPLLSIGTLFLCLQLIPFQLSIANGYNKLSVRLGFFSLAIYPLLLVYFCKVLGVTGATIPWVVINALNFLVLTFFVNTRFYTGCKKWMLLMCLLPVTISFILISLGCLLANILQLDYVLHFSMGVIFGVVAILINWFVLIKWIHI